MQKIILEKLDGICESNQVRILYACESGSRAWGFASQDSDYDVRFIYAQPTKHYISVANSRDVIELPVNEVLDIGGWDLKKALALYRKTNAALFEWLQSPIVYSSDADFHKQLLQGMEEVYSMRAGFHHYFSMAAACFEKDLQHSEVRIKKYFYALRPVLAAKWILDKQSVPPMEIDKLRMLIKEVDLQSAIDDLLFRKESSDEKTVIAQVPLIHRFLENTLEYCRQRKDLPAIKEVPLETVDRIFRKTIGINDALLA